MRILVLINNLCRNRERIFRQLKKELPSLGQVSFAFTSGREDAIVLSHSFSRSYDVIVAVGGDGHINEVINGLFAPVLRNLNDSNYFCTESFFRERSTPLAILPAGTGNDYVRTFSITHRIEDLKHRLRRFQVKPVDLGLIRYRTWDHRTGFRLFDNITDIGIGAEVLARVEDTPDWVGGNVAHILAIWNTLYRFSLKPLIVHTDQFDYRGSLASIVIAKGKYFGSGIGIAPQSIPDDGQFGVTIIGKVGPKEFVRFLAPLKKGKKVSHQEIHYLKASRIVVQSLEREFPVQMDGEFLGTTPVEFLVIPKILPLVI